MNNLKQTTTNPLKHKNYLSYLYANSKNASPVIFFKNIYKFLKKYILVGRIFKFLRLLFLWIQTGAYFVLISTFLLILIPIVSVSVFIFILYTVYMHKKANRYFSKLIKDNTFCIIFKNNEDDITSDCNDASVKIYVITNPFSKLTDCVTVTDEKRYLISTSYFYSLKKKVLDKQKEKVFYN